MRKKMIVFLALVTILFFRKELKYYARYAIEMGEVKIFPIDSYPNQYIITNAPKDNRELMKITTSFVLFQIKNNNYQKDSSFMSYFFYKESPNLNRDFKFVEYDEWGWNWNADDLMSHIEDLRCTISFQHRNNKEVLFNFHSYNPEGYNFYKYGIPSLGIRQPVWLIEGKYYDSTSKEIVLSNSLDNQ